ncbi:MAG TPA: hypothetical protein VFT22_09585 [Kofleriaceae bacterium]|nr:hypothetical protein [Kofleriaceae bacterium]
MYRQWGRLWLVLELDGGVVSVEVGHTDVLDAAPAVTSPSGTTVLSGEGARRLVGLLDACLARLAADAGGDRWAKGADHGV